MPSLTINTSFGAVQVSYSTREELEEILKSLSIDIELIENSIVPTQSQQGQPVKPGFESAYAFVGGKVELLIDFKDGTKSVATVLYAYYPNMATRKDIIAATGIEDFATKVVGQTNNKKYFIRDGESYGLSDAGRKYVLEKIKPKLPAGAKEPESPPA